MKIFETSKFALFIFRGIILSLFIFSIFLVIVPAQTKAAWDPSNIISDATFSSKNTMSQQDIQNFLVSKNSYLANYRETRSVLIGTNNDRQAQGKLASQIIFEAANDYSLNPQAILVTLQKEQSLITNSALNQYGLDYAMGYGCFDANGCTSNSYPGFSMQVDWATWQLSFNQLKANSSDTAQQAKVAPYITGHTISIDGLNTYLSNGATASLYRYTPHFHGNQNFYNLFSSWFPLETWDLLLSTKYYSGRGNWSAAQTKFVAAGDYNNDGKDDMAAIYDYGNGKIGIWVFISDGTVFTPSVYYISGNQQWNASSIKFLTAGDYDGNSTTDLAAMYDYGNGRMGLWTFNLSGNQFTPHLNYVTNEYQWNASSTASMVSGDFNFDGKTDLAMVYDYGRSRMGIWTFTSGGDQFNPNVSYITNENQWNVDSTRLISSGDYNGDGKSDISAIYDYGNNNMSIFIFQSNGTNFAPRSAYSSGVNNWSALSTKFMVSGDYNKDGYDDIEFAYDYGSNKMGLWIFNYSDGTFTPKLSYFSKDWNMSATKFMLYTKTDSTLVLAKTEIDALYDYGNNSMGIVGLQSR